MYRIPSLSCLAPDAADALNSMVALVHDVMEDMRANGECIPEPIAAKSYSGKFMVRIPAEQHRNLVIQAVQNGVSLNRYIAKNYYKFIGLY